MMAKQLAARKIYCNNHAPIWAWDSCGKYEKVPSLQDARSLLSGIELDAGIQTIEFECPVKLVFFSIYGIWNIVLDEIYFSKDEPKIDKKTEDLLFKIEKKLKKYNDIQATLPY